MLRTGMQRFRSQDDLAMEQRSESPMRKRSVSQEALGETAAGVVGAAGTVERKDRLSLGTTHAFASVHT